MNWMSKSTLEWFIRTDTLSLHNKCLMFTFSSFSSCFEHVSTKKHSHRRRKCFANCSHSLARKEVEICAKIFEPCWRHYSSDVRGSRKGAVSVEEFRRTLKDSNSLPLLAWSIGSRDELLAAKKKLHFLAFFLRFLALTSASYALARARRKNSLSSCGATICARPELSAARWTMKML